MVHGMNGIMQIKTLKTIMGLGILMSSSIFNLASAQVNPFSVPDPEEKVIKRDAELIFDNFHKFGLSLQAHYLPFFNQSNYSFNNYYPDRITWAVGVDYNFYQTRNFNFRVGAYVRNFNIAQKVDIPFSIFDVDREDNLIFTETEGPNWNYNFNLSAEYLTFIAKNVAFNFYLGSELMYFDSGILDDQVFDSFFVEGIARRETSLSDNPTKVTIGLTTGAGLYFRAGKTMIRTNLNYKFSLSGVIISESHRWKNLSNAPGSNIGSHGWDGHHFSFSMTIHPGKKNIKDRLRNINNSN